MKLNVTRPERQALQDFIYASTLGPWFDRSKMARGIAAVVGSETFHEMRAHANAPGIGIKIEVVEKVTERLTEKEEVWRPKG